MIPVIGIPYMVRSDLLERLLNSIDVHVERYIFIDNSEAHDLANLTGPNITVIAPRHNLGVAASWNLIIKATPLAPWWTILNADVAFTPGDLDKYIEVMREFDGICNIDGYAAFGLSRSVVERVGFFDENFVPAYYEDNDYAYRGNLVGVNATTVATGIIHYGSEVIRYEERWRSANATTFPENARYYAAKWGGLPGEEKYRTPFDSGADPRFWFLDMRRLSTLTWR